MNLLNLARNGWDRRLHEPQPTMVYPELESFHTVRAGIVPGDNRFRPIPMELYMHGRFLDPGMELYPPRAAVAPRTPANQ